jgi:hypothetical protein
MMLDRHSPIPGEVWRKSTVPTLLHIAWMACSSSRSKCWLPSASTTAQRLASASHRRYLERLPAAWGVQASRDGYDRRPAWVWQTACDVCVMQLPIRVPRGHNKRHKALAFRCLLLQFARHNEPLNPASALCVPATLHAQYDRGGHAQYDRGDLPQGYFTATPSTLSTAPASTPALKLRGDKLADSVAVL